MHQDPHLHLLGSPTFFPELITYIRSISNLASLPVDQVIIKSVLLCLIAGDKHLILRTPEEDIGLVVKLVAWVSPRLSDLRILLQLRDSSGREP